MNNVNSKIDYKATYDDDIRIISESGKFDEAWYLFTYQDVRLSGGNPIAHYVNFGAHENRNPSRTFNTKRYLERMGGQGAIRCNPFAHFILHGSTNDFVNKGLLEMLSDFSIKAGMRRLSRLPLFSINDYIVLNADLGPEVQSGTIDPVNHAFVYGFPEGRNVFLKTRIAHVLGTFCRPVSESSKPLSKTSKKKRLSQLPRIGIFYNAEGNGFIKELANELVSAIKHANMDAILLDENSSIDKRPTINVVVAPHEFFHIGNGPAWVRDDFITESFMFNTEQPQTLWFERGMPFILMSRGVMDISHQVAKIFDSAGLPALHFNPNMHPVEKWLHDDDFNHPLVRALPKAAQRHPKEGTKFKARPIDISFFGNDSPHRDNFFVKSAKFLSDYETFLYYRKFTDPLKLTVRDGALSRIAGHVSAHSKISVNIHRDDSGFFEWHRIVRLGMLGGSIVVSELCLPHPIFKPGIHYIEECARQIPNVIEWLLRSKDGQERAELIQRNLLEIIQDDVLSITNSTNLVQFIKMHHEVAS